MNSIETLPTSPSDHPASHGNRVRHAYMSLKRYERWLVAIIGILAFMPIISTALNSDWSAVPFIAFISLALAWLLATVSWVGFTSILHFMSSLVTGPQNPHPDRTNKHFATTWGIIGLILGFYGIGAIASGAHDASILYALIFPWLFILVLTLVAKVTKTPGVAAGFAMSLWYYPIGLLVIIAWSLITS